MFAGPAPGPYSMLLSPLRPFLAVYAVAFVALIADLTLISRMPQGVRWTGDFAVDLVAFVALFGLGVWLARHGRIRAAAAAFAFASVCSVTTANLLAHLAPAYIGRHLPFFDHQLAWWDGVLGFDWNAYFRWHVEHPAFAAVARAAYLAWPYLALALVAILAFYGQIERLARFLIATSLSLLLVYVVAILTPSYGAYTHYGMAPSMHAGLTIQFADFRPTWDALRAGVVDIYAAEVPAGAISFPSFHTTTVLLYVWAAWRTPARWPVFVSQVLAFLAIPVQGAHFFADMIAGGLIGVAAIALSRPAVKFAEKMPLRGLAGEPRAVAMRAR